MPKSMNYFKNLLNLLKTLYIISFLRLFRNEGKFPERVGFRVLTEYRAKRVENYATGGILVDNGEVWWRVRSKAQQPFLKTKNITNYVPILGKIGDEFIDR